MNVFKTEEKGSDVNIASHLLIDAFEDSFDCAVVVSGDSDLKFPIQKAIDKFHKTVGVINPHKKVSVDLKKIARFYKHIRESALKRNQFPPIMSDAIGSFHKPSSW